MHYVHLSLLESALATPDNIYTAPWYQNEHIIGGLLRRGRLKREEIKITTKLYAKDQGLDAQRGLDDSLTALSTEWIDIYLIHHPHCDAEQCDGTWKTSWRVIEDYYFKNKIKFVGVSNFDISEWHELLDWTRIPVSVVQNWLDPFRQADRHIIAECRELGIVYQVEACIACLVCASPQYNVCHYKLSGI